MKTIRGVEVVECTEMSLVEKDVIKLTKFEDFQYMIGSHSVIFKLGNTYYIKDPDTIYTYEEK